MDAPVYALPGNHDDDVLMQQYFPDGPWNGPLIVQAGHWQLVLLKSALAGRIDGVIGQALLGGRYGYSRGRISHRIR
jgi:3',5'-cyclic AMP phosphodiesterase CpdA